MSSARTWRMLLFVVLASSVSSKEGSAPPDVTIKIGPSFALSSHAARRDVSVDKSASFKLLAKNKASALSSRSGLTAFNTNTCWKGDTLTAAGKTPSHCGWERKAFQVGWSSSWRVAVMSGIKRERDSKRWCDDFGIQGGRDGAEVERIAAVCWSGVTRKFHSASLISSGRTNLMNWRRQVKRSHLKMDRFTWA